MTRESGLFRMVKGIVLIEGGLGGLRSSDLALFIYLFLSKILRNNYTKREVQIANVGYKFPVNRKDWLYSALDESCHNLNVD